MAKTYYKLIKKGLKEYSEVPDTWKEAVKALLEADGLTQQDDGSWK